VWLGVAAAALVCATARPAHAQGQMQAQSQENSAVIRLVVDARGARQKMLHATLDMPVKPGPLTLYYPKWIPGEHAPDGPILDLAGLEFFADGKRLGWRRDLDDMFTFHLVVPEGAGTLEVHLDFLLSAPAAGFSGGASATSQLMVLSWNQVLLYPAGRPARKIEYQPSLRLPEGWKYATALPGAHERGDTVEFAEVPLNTLVDSPVLAGTHLRVIPLAEDPHHEMDVAADSEGALALSNETIQKYRNLVAETGALFGARHYRDYHFLVTLSDSVAHFGLEHHESSDDRLAEASMTDGGLRVLEADLLPHEFVHSWNGKYRRPADLATPDYEQPMRDDLLWVYEGLTEYLGDILTARSRLWTVDEWREHLAYVAATMDQQAGRTWRPLQDTADAAQILYAWEEEWGAWRRGTDFYDEGLLIWLEADTIIRNQTKGKKSLNDFCRQFHGGEGGTPALKTYTVEDVVAGMNAVAPYDWAGFFKTRLESYGPGAPLGGIAGGGWNVVYDELPNSIMVGDEVRHGGLDLTFSSGMVVGDDGEIRDVIPGAPAYAAGLAPDLKILSVNGRKFSPEALREAIRKAKQETKPIELRVADGAYESTHELNYHGGLLYPHLVRIADQPDVLGQIIQPLAKGN
jgi:predicted metalloprotease with PDZ domain